MKRFLKIIICIILSITMQCAILLYFDKVLLKESSEFTPEKVDITTKKVDTNVSIPANAEKVQVSFNGRYITYFLDNKFMLVNTKTAETTQILADTEILTTEWVPNNNKILVVEKLSNKINVKTYNANNGVEQPVREICTYKKNMEVRAVISITTEYICISRGEDSTTIYRIDINNEMKTLNNEVEDLGSVKVFWDKDVLLYEDSSSKKFYRYTNGSVDKLNLKNANNLLILGAANNKIYMGELSGDKVVKIIYGEDGKRISKWQTKNLDKPKDINDIYINENGEILVNDVDTRKIHNIITGNVITYEGKFISVNDKVICSSENEKIFLKSVADVDKK